MEKFSAYRDPGTGIQPFLTPIPPPNPNGKVFSTLLLPLGYIIGVARSTLIMFFLVAYVVIVHGVFSVFLLLPPIHRIATGVVTSILCRSVLFLLGLFWIPVEIVSRKRSRNHAPKGSWNPVAGDIIVSNWASWIELLWLAFRFNPIFVLPAPDSAVVHSDPSAQPTAITHTPGRRTGTGSANIASTTRTSTPQIAINGFYPVSLLTMISRCGNTPPYSIPNTKPRTLEDIRWTAKQPIVLFPECTTSNGRGLMRFADVFNLPASVRGWNIYIICVRYDPPTAFTPTLSHSIPSNVLNPLLHMFSLTTSTAPLTMSVKLLAPSDSPSSPTFVASEVLGDSSKKDQLTEACASLIAQIGKLKRMTMGWEDKSRFIEFYRGRRSS
ncbi:hypothetical protein K435DRAFT_641943 [Dendrothele bispora CBS 962.96]|uniref:Phospholipid/glycerol acyltransferase domain-containing protein n=1 Tax=Dendrothele bispora (strain CBS 962.96) TaxID=1314807 RepID=A0A4S8N1A7_DENBC|nr:hypothetical protein K435DRAFT_641943 [Dendrothele bispora CBS 962.96]